MSTRPTESLTRTPSQKSSSSQLREICPERHIRIFSSTTWTRPPLSTPSTPSASRPHLAPAASVRAPARGDLMGLIDLMGL